MRQLEIAKSSNLDKLREELEEKDAKLHELEHFTSKDQRSAMKSASDSKKVVKVYYIQGDQGKNTRLAICSQNRWNIIFFLKNLRECSQDDY